MAAAATRSLVAFRPAFVQRAALPRLMLFVSLAILVLAHLAPHSDAERPIPARSTHAEEESTSTSVISTPAFVKNLRRQLLFERISCGRSRLKGYTSTKRLTSGLSLHWKATLGRTVKVALVASGKPAGGWFAMGWSRNGQMDGSNVVAMEDAGNSPGVYDLVGNSAANAASWTVGSPSITTSGGKVIMKFTKNKGDGASVRVKGSGNNNIVWAYGDGNAVSMHTNRGKAVVNFACGCPLFRNSC